MKRRYLVLLFATFFMFLYIGPVNLLPYDVSPAIVQRPQEANPTLEKSDGFVVATDISVPVEDYYSDDWWRWEGTEWTTHNYVGGQIECHNVTPFEYVGQFRFQLPIEQGATIDSADFYGYEVDDEGSTEGATVKRLNETNVGSFADDTVKPAYDNDTTALYTGWDGVDSEWRSVDVTELVQNQVDLVDWESGFYVGLQFWNAFTGSDWHKWESENAAGTNEAYLNVSYTIEEPVEPYGANWLAGFGKRQQHNISQTDGTGENYTVPIEVYNGLGSSWYGDAYTNGYAQADFDDIRFTANDGNTTLEYRRYEITSGGEVTDYISNSSVDYANYPVNYPSAFYYNQRTYIVRHGPERDPFITYYDHENNTWGGWYGIGDNSILDDLDDGHGAPALFVDDEGYIHVFWGGHYTSQRIQHSKSDSPENITSWSFVNEIVWSQAGQTYPHLYYDATNDLLHMYARTSPSGGTQRWIEYRNSTDKGVTWSNGWYILDMSDAAPYFGAGSMDSTNTTLSIAFQRYGFGVGDDDIYYLRANFSSKTVYNAGGDSQGETVTDGELVNCLLFATGGCGSWYPNVHVDQNDYPYVTWAIENTTGLVDGVIMFTYWTGSAWASIENVTNCWNYVAAYDFIVHSNTSITGYFSDYPGVNQKNIMKCVWDGVTWVKTLIYEGGARFVSFSTVPMHYVNEIQVTFSEYVPGSPTIKMWAYGTGGFVQYTWPEHALFYVRVSENLTLTDATIYLYYANGSVSTTQNATMTIDTGNDPDHGLWGVEETAAGYFNPVNYQAPTFDNPDDTDNMYARYKEYNITMYASDQNGYADIDFLKLGFWDDGRSNNYARWRYDSPENTFVEEYDWDDYFELNLTKSEAIKSGDVINCTFVFTVDWSCPDMTDVHIAVTVRDNIGLYDVDDFHFLTWDVETRLDFTTGPTLNDGSGTVDRGDYDTLDGITASGTVDYYGSAISPDSAEVDVWVSCSDVEGGPWSDTTLTAGVFSVTVDSDNVVGLDTYSFIVVEKDEGVGGSDLSHTSHSDTYIADRLIVDIQADDETPFNNQQVVFTLTIIYDYDDAVCSTYTVVISRNTVWWHTFIDGNKSLFVDTNSDVAYVYTTYDISESTHGLTKYSSGSESVTWSGETTTTTTFPTTTVTETGIFYDLFLSLDMWGYLGPLGIVVIGYVLAKKDRGLGLIAFMVQCLIAAQYFALVAATPAYWWHIFIILFGGIFSCVVPLMDKR